MERGENCSVVAEVAAGREDVGERLVLAALLAGGVGRAGAVGGDDEAVLDPVGAGVDPVGRGISFCLLPLRGV